MQNFMKLSMAVYGLWVYIVLTEEKPKVNIYLKISDDAENNTVPWIKLD